MGIPRRSRCLRHVEVSNGRVVLTACMQFYSRARIHECDVTQGMPELRACVTIKAGRSRVVAVLSRVAVVALRRTGGTHVPTGWATLARDYRGGSRNEARTCELSFVRTRPGRKCIGGDYRKHSWC